MEHAPLLTREKSSIPVKMMPTALWFSLRDTPFERTMETRMVFFREGKKLPMKTFCRNNEYLAHLDSVFFRVTTMTCFMPRECEVKDGRYEIRGTLSGLRDTQTYLETTVELHWKITALKRKAKTYEVQDA